MIFFLKLYNQSFKGHLYRDLLFMIIICHFLNGKSITVISSSVDQYGFILPYFCAGIDHSDHGISYQTVLSSFVFNWTKIWEKNYIQLFPLINWKFHLVADLFGNSLKAFSSGAASFFSWANPTWPALPCSFLSLRRQLMFLEHQKHTHLPFVC